MYGVTRGSGSYLWVQCWSLLPLLPPPDPVLYEKALAEQERRAHNIVYGMSAGLYTKLLRLVMCLPGRSPSIWLLYCPALLPLHFIFQPLHMDVLCATFSLLSSQRLPSPFFSSLLTFLFSLISPSSSFPPLTRLAGFVLFWVFSRLFNRVCVQKRHIAMLKQAKEVRQGAWGEGVQQVEEGGSIAWSIFSVYSTPHAHSLHAL